MLYTSSAASCSTIVSKYPPEPAQPCMISRAVLPSPRVWYATSPMLVLLIVGMPRSFLCSFGGPRVSSALSSRLFGGVRGTDRAGAGLLMFLPLSMAMAPHAGLAAV